MLPHFFSLDMHTNIYFPSLFSILSALFFAHSSFKSLGHLRLLSLPRGARLDSDRLFGSRLTTERERERELSKEKRNEQMCIFLPLGLIRLNRGEQSKSIGNLGDLCVVLSSSVKTTMELNYSMSHLTKVMMV